MDNNLILQEFNNKLLNIYTGWFNCNCFLALTTHFPEDSATHSSECSQKGVNIWLIVRVQLHHCYNHY